MAVFQPPNSQRTLRGWSMRSEANFRLSECQPRPRLGCNPASIWAFLHQLRGTVRPTLLDGYFGEGNTGVSPIPGFRLRASSNTASTSAVTGVRCS